MVQLQTQLQEKTQLISDLEGQIKRSSDQSKTLQAQSSANFAQVEQMKQQVLRDRAELSKKLSLIAPETTRRIEHLQHEREVIHQQFQEMSSSLATLSQQKSEVLEKLAKEVSRNSELVRQNTQLRHQLALQLDALGYASGELVQTTQQQVAEEAKVLERNPSSSSSSDSPTTSSSSALQIDEKADSYIVEVEAVPERKPTVRTGGGKKSGAKAKRTSSSQQRTSSSSSPSSLAQSSPPSLSSSSSSSSTSHTHATHPQSPSSAIQTHPSSQNGGFGSPHTNQKGWLASVPLVGRLWKGQPQVRHTAQVEL